MTLAQLHALGCNIEQVFFCWAEPPSALNINFKDINNDTLKQVYKIMKNPVLANMFANLDWFDLGLTVRDIMSLRPDFNTLVLFNVTVDKLILHNAHDFGENWQSLLQWTTQEWEKLGFQREKYYTILEQDALRLKNRPSTTLSSTRRAWGPRET